MSFSRSYAFKDNGLSLVWNAQLEAMVEPNVHKRERAMGFPTETTQVSDIMEFQYRHLLSQAMDLNCLSWIIALLSTE